MRCEAPVAAWLRKFKRSDRRVALTGIVGKISDCLTHSVSHSVSHSVTQSVTESGRLLEGLRPVVYTPQQ